MLKLQKILQLTLIMTFTVIILGAYTRLKDAGLGCPDWPGCYGRLFVPDVTAEFTQTAATKAWIEMIHRYVAGTLGLLILYIAIQALRLRSTIPNLWIYTTVVLALVVFQALLGMWTVTLGLYPIVVMGHLLGGITILALLWCIHLKITRSPQAPEHKINRNIQMLSIACTIVIALQIALGGWTSANYAALVCSDFPTCQGHIWPAMDWTNAFNVTSVGIFNSPGTPLENNARVTIQMAHRIGAMLTALLVIILGLQLLRSSFNKFKKLGILLLVLLGIQLMLGIFNVLYHLPLMISLAHTATAVLLILLSITILWETC